MTAGPDHLARIAGMRQLAGKQLPYHRDIVEPVRALQKVVESTKNWEVFTPRKAAIDAAIVQLDGIVRALRELRVRLYEQASQEGSDADS